MQTSDSISILEDIGLSEKEAQVYFSALTLGPATVLELARKSGVKRSTVYSIIETLTLKGLMHTEVHGLKDRYVAENPEMLWSFVQSRQRAFQSALPQFSALYNLQGGESVNKYYEGLKGVKTAYLELLNSMQPGEDYFVIGPIESWTELDPKFFQRFIEERAKLDLHIRMLFHPSSEAERRQRIQAQYKEEIKILPESTYLTTNLVIVPTRVLVHQIAAPTKAMVIENKSLVDHQQQLFEIIWSAL